MINKRHINRYLHLLRLTFSWLSLYFKLKILGVLGTFRTKINLI